MIIDLATFNINTDQLFQKLTQTRAEIERLKAQQKDLQKEFTNSNKSVDENQKKLNDLNAELQGLTRGTATYNETVALRDVAERQLNASLAQQAEINARYQTQLTQNRLELNQLSNQARSYETVLNTQNRATNESIDLYTRQRAELSLLQREQREMGATLIQMERNGEQSTQAFKELTTAYNDASVRAEELATSLRGVDTAGGNFTSNIGNYKSALEDFKGALFSGDTQGLKDSFNAITGSIKGMITQSLAFIATPIGAAITALVGIGAAAKAVFDFNEGIKESNQLLKGLGVASGEISKVRTELEATAETYGKSFEEIAKTADSLATSYGISISEANDIIAKGLVQGGAANEDFLNQISEYDVQFQQLGFTAEESLAAINAGFAEGVYNDKLPDALKELGLSLAEGTKASADALTNAFGQTFSDNLLKGVGSGTITIKDALQQIGDKSNEVGLNLQQQQQLTADVFRGAGEDAGGALKIIEILNTAQNKGYTDAEKSIENLRLANERLNQAQAKLFEIADFGSVWADIQAFAVNFFVDVLDYIAELKQDFQPLIDIISYVLVVAFQSAKESFSLFFNVVSGGFKVIANTIGTFVKVAKALLTGDFAGAFSAIQKGISNFGNIIENTFGRIKNSIISSIQNIVSGVKPILSALGVDVDKLQKRLDGFKNKKVLIEDAKKENEKQLKAEAKPKTTQPVKLESDKAKDKSVKDAQKAKEDAQKKAEEEAKKELDSAQKLADEKIKLANIELNAYIEKNKSILENEKYLTAELLKQEQERIKNVTEAKLQQKELEFNANNDKLNSQIVALEKEKTLTKTQANELATLRLQQQEQAIQYDADLTKIKEDGQKQITATETRYSNERIEAEKMRKAVQYQTELLELESKGASEQEIKKAQLDQNTQLELEKFIEKQDLLFQTKIEKDQEQRDIQAEIDLVQEELQNELAVAKDENEKIRLQTKLAEINNLEANFAKAKQQITQEEVKSKLNAYNRLFGDIRGLFGEETAVAKAAGIAQAGINTYLGATAVLADKTVPTFAKPILVGTTIASGLQSVAKIIGIKGFATGGKIKGGYEISRENGDNRLITAKDGEVILTEQQQIALGGANVFKQIGVPGFATGGVVGGVSSLQNVQNQFANQANDVSLSETIKQAVIEGSTIGTATGSQRGISELNENAIIAQKSNF